MFAAELHLFPQERLSKRRRARHRTSDAAEAEAIRFLCHVQEISLGGARIELYGEIDHATPLTIVLPGRIERSARVVWSEGFEISCAFEDPLDEAELARLEDRFGRCDASLSKLL